MTNDELKREARTLREVAEASEALHKAANWLMNAAEAGELDALGRAWEAVKDAYGSMPKAGILMLVRRGQSEEYADRP